MGETGAMTGLAWGILAVTAVLAVGDWVARATENRRLEFVCKPATTIGLLAVALTLDPTDPTTRAWFVVALVFSLAGDVFLMIGGDESPTSEVNEELWFTLGLGSFLVGHLAYIVGLVVSGVDGGALIVGVVVVLGAMLLVGRRIVTAVRSSDEPGLAVPVAAYMTVISTMVACAFGTASALAIGGASLFYLSDALIGWNRFVKSYAWGPVAIMVTYHLAQAGLVLSLT